MKLNSDRTTMIECTVWPNAVTYDGVAAVQYGITFSRSYKTEEGWKNGSHSYRNHDLPVLLFLLQKAHEWCLLQRATCPF